MSQPLASIRGNVVLGSGSAQARAVYRVKLWPGPGLMAALAAAVPAGFSLLRVTQAWSLDRYVIGVEAVTDIRHAHRRALGAHLDGERRYLGRRVVVHRPKLFLSVQLPQRLTLEELMEKERSLRPRLLLGLGCERAHERELTWLYHSAFRRGLPDDLGEEPPSECSITVTARSVRIVSELGESHQAFLCLTPRPEDGARSSWPADRLLAPVEVVDFPVDVALSASGTAAAGNGGPHLLCGGASLGVSAASEDELERRIDVLRLRLPALRLHRPVGEQLRLFLSHLPGQPSRLPAYDSGLRPAELAAMLPTPPPKLGTRSGPYIGHTIGGVARPVLFDPAAISREAAPGVLMVGGPGTGKTLASQLIMYQAFLVGSLVCDVDTAGDHVLNELPELREHATVLELSAEAGFRGALDPLQLAPVPLRERLALDLFRSLLPVPVPVVWERALAGAVRAVARGGGGSAGVIDELAGRPDPGPELASALEARVGAGPALLALGGAGPEPPEFLGAQATVLRIPELTPGEALCGPLGRVLSLYALRLAARDPRRNAVLGLDGALGPFSDPVSRELVRHVASVARSRRVTPLVGARTLRGAEALDDLVSVIFCFRAWSEREADRALRALGLGDGDLAARRALLSFDPGGCLMRDQAERVGAMQVDVANRQLVRALGACPTGRPRDAVRRQPCTRTTTGFDAPGANG